MITAAHLVNRLLEGESAKRFLQHAAAERENAARAQKERERVKAEPCQDWADWDELREWQQTAAREMEAREDTIFELFAHDHASFQIVSPSRVYFQVFENDDAARAEAVSDVVCKLENEPGLFTQDWLESFINSESLRDSLYSDVESMMREDLEHRISDAADKRDKLHYDSNLDTSHFYDENDDPLELTPESEAAIDALWEDYVEAEATARLGDPVQYLKDIYGNEDGVKQAINIAGINYADAAESAVQADGWQHFLARYDGNSDDLPSGAVVVRTN